MWYIMMSINQFCEENVHRISGICYGTSGCSQALEVSPV